ncbi:MAG: bifunctional glutamate N-acetyltransferase/amino-acid acetyltransferase ArgJ [Candidatus Sumerlaeia bacterium]|nr:bifunctional glutamate N-acetyltransferase/amino-acid acetyltransferase ArgJ [Candidatus Sumerlaeia bacterium]
MNKRELITIKGFKASGVTAGIKASGKKDLALIYAEQDCSAAGVFTKNKFPAAPIVVSREHLRAEPESIRAIVINSGNANACTGEEGINNARMMAEQTAKNLKLRTSQVLVASTGVIGRPLPMDKVIGGINQAISRLKVNGWLSAARAIMTTDTRPKLAQKIISGPVQDISFLGMAKGAGMIHPRLATMLAFIITDAVVTHTALQKALQFAVDRSFHCLTIDGDTSTNDSVILLARAPAGAEPGELISENSENFLAFRDALLTVCVDLVRQIAADGEGATKLVEITVTGASSYEDARAVAKQIAQSLLVKTALFGNDPNWGRIVCAVGNTDALFDPQKVIVKIGDYIVFKHGVPHLMDVGLLRDYLKQNQRIEITVELGAGTDEIHFWTCDLSTSYVKINAHYHT